MGVPAFYRWLSEKYPKIVLDVLEERVELVDGSYNQKAPFDLSRPNPNGIECNNLYIDMNGIIHPCSHPEIGPQPTCEEEMYENVCAYVDHLLRVHRPRSLLYLAIDGVAPRAKMNQQRSRRFRAAQEARELAQLEQQIKQEVYNDDDDNMDLANGSDKDKTKVGGSGAWDSNVITPGTPFMLKLAEYVRFYIRKRISTDPGWKKLKVIFSDASIPGEGEHKIMNHIRAQRTCPGYNANTVHVLHGLDADLIMLALATHEVHFYISREEVTFGRKSEEMKVRRQTESGYLRQQQQYNQQVGDLAMQLLENQRKPIQMLSIPILREYIAIEFEQTLARIPFQPVSLERLIDDFVFMCFFVGNDFLPHLPSLDIRDGALDFLINVYQRILPTFSDYITRSGGYVNLSNVDVLLAEVGQIEDYVFQMKHEAEQQEQRRRAELDGNRKNKTANQAAPPTALASTQHHQVRGKAAKILEKQKQEAQNESITTKGNHKEDAIALQSTRRLHIGGHPPNVKNKHIGVDDTKTAPNGTIKVTHLASKREKNAVVKNGVASGQPTNEEYEEISDNETSNNHTKKNKNTTICSDNLSNGENDDEDSLGDELTDMSRLAKSTKRSREESSDTGSNEDGFGQVGEFEDEFDVDDDDDDDDVAPPIVKEIVKKVRDPKLAEVVKEKVKAAQQKQLDTYAKSVVDNVRLHEKGWKDRYYSDKCKADDVKNHGGREHLFRNYVMGLCWVMRYYYDGVPSWKWYYPFHYGPFASDLKNIERFEKDCKSFEVSIPFNPVEQLMAVLPSDSSHAIPKAARWLMSDPESPILDFYPTEVPVDPNGKAMPWLWVVLLPFIDEDRLLSAVAPTMTQWTPSELLCNARGLDDGYLYIHRLGHGPLSSKIVSVLSQALSSSSGSGGRAGGAMKVRLANAIQYGLSGSVRPPLSNEYYPPDEDVVIPAPSSSSNISINTSDTFSEPIDPNDAACVAFTEPPKLSHKSILLPGVRIPPPILLAPEDRLIRRPRLNRFGGTIANMGGSNSSGQRYGGGSMNISQYERDVAQQQGRGHEMYQTGTRSWGSMEPTPKRFHYQGGGGGLNNMNQSSVGARPHRQKQKWNNQQGQQQSPAYIIQQTNHQQPQQQQQQQPFNHMITTTSYPEQYQHHQQYQRQVAQLPAYQQMHASTNSAVSHQNFPYNGASYSGQYNTIHHPHLQQLNHQGKLTIPPPPPPPPIAPQAQQQQQRYNFRSFTTQSAGMGAGGRVGQNNNLQQPRAPAAASTSRANADVMNSLRAQLTSTLQQNRKKSGNNSNHTAGGPPNYRR